MSASSSPSSLLPIRHLCFMFILQIKWIRSITDPAAISPDRLLFTNVSALQKTELLSRSLKKTAKNQNLFQLYMLLYHIFMDVNNKVHFAEQRWLNVARHVWPTTTALIHYRHLLAKLPITETNVIVNRQTIECFRLLRNTLYLLSSLTSTHKKCGTAASSWIAWIHGKALSVKCKNNLI